MYYYLIEIFINPEDFASFWQKENNAANNPVQKHTGLFLHIDYIYKPKPALRKSSSLATCIEMISIKIFLTLNI